MPNPAVIGAGPRVQSSDVPVLAGLLADFNPANAVVNAGVVDSLSYGSLSLTQAVGSRKPAYTNTLGGKPLMTFTAGNGTHLAGAASLAAAMDSNDPWTVYYVGQITGLTTAPYALWGISNSSTDYAYNYHQNFMGLGRGPGAVNNTSSGTPGTSVFDCCVNYTGSAYNIWLNGTQVLTSASNTVSPVCNLFCLGAIVISSSIVQPMTGHLGRFLVYGASHTTQRTTISSWLRSFYGI